ncbi:Ankyrin-3 (ANK-3) (Ankyrin-G) [Durusdinium trenchii]|uniref:Ankyrin-3 (ANK-3) (Ankyrin-G) n=1 Tax=Durusdinium trenchii TaxID=1381693 RepID=A0ABP0R8B9_9DINO
MLSWSNSSPVKDLPVFERSEGVYLYDSNGKRYLDWTSQAVCVNLGYTVPESIKDRAECWPPWKAPTERKIQEHKEKVGRPLNMMKFTDLGFVDYGGADARAILISDSPQWWHAPIWYGGLGLAPVRAKLARLMAEICPGDLNGFLFPSGGGEANEAAIRMARLYTGKQKIFTQYRSYHGGSTSSLGATGDFRRRFTESNTHGFVKFFNPQPSGFSWGSTDQSATRRTLATLEDQILAEGPDTIAAIMVESIVGAGGVLVPPEGYIEGVRSLCDKYDILMICDEVMVGFGRTGHFFAFQHFEGVIPDMVTSAKGLTGSYLPLSMVGVRQKIKNYFWEKPVGWGATYHAHPVAVACAYETVKYMLKVEGTAVKFLKQRLAEQIGVSRFRQRWFSHDYTEFQDDDELTLDLDVQVIVLDFMTPLPEDRMQLALACAANGSLVLEALLRDRCLPPDAADECGQTALQVAASKGHLDCMSFLARFCKMFFAIPGSAKGDLGEAGRQEAVQLLLENGAESELVAGYDEETPLHLAALAGCTEVVRLLLEHGADRDCVTINGEAALHLAAKASEVEVVRLLLEDGDDKDKAQSLSGATALHLAAGYGSAEVVELLLEAKADQDKTALCGKTALHEAAEVGQLKVVRLLLQAAVDMNKVTRSGTTALQLALVFGHQEVAELLQTHAELESLGVQGAPVKFLKRRLAQEISVNRFRQRWLSDPDFAPSSDGQAQQLIAAAASPDAERLESLLRWPLNPEAAEKPGRTALRKLMRKLLAADTTGDDDENNWYFGPVIRNDEGLACLSLLLEAGAKTGLEEANEEGFTALHVAAYEGDLELVGQLLEAGADQDKATNVGTTALHSATRGGHAEVVRFLLEAGAKPNKWSYYEGTALHVATEHADLKLLELLLAHGADANIVNSMSETPLHLAARAGRKVVVRRLLEAKADADKATSEGLTALDFAIQQGHQEVVQLWIVSDCSCARVKESAAQGRHEALPPMPCAGIGLVDELRVVTWLGTWGSLAPWRQRCLDLQNPNGHFIQRLGGASPPEVQLLRQAMRDQGLMALFRPPLLHCAPPLVIQARRGAHCGELRSLRCAVLLVWRDPTSRAIFLAYNLGWCYLESVPMVLFVFRVIWSDLRCQSASLLWEFKHLNFMRCTRIIRWASNRLPYTTWGSRVDTPCNDYLDFSGSQIV